MLNNMEMNLTKVFIAVLLLFINTSPLFAQLYGVPVSNVGNVSVLSPNKEWSVSVKLNKEKLPILTIQREPNGDSEELMGVSRSGWVLWSPNSKTLAFTDAAFANHYFVHMCSNEPVGKKCHDISSEIESLVKANLSRENIDKLYVKALKWKTPNIVIVGVCVVTSPRMQSGQIRVPTKISYRAFLVNAKTGHITEELSKRKVRIELGSNLDQLEW